MKRRIFIILHNIRSAYNVGSVFRTADGAGVAKIYLTGYTPSPAQKNKKNENSLYVTHAQKMIAKTALGAEESVLWEKKKNLSWLLEKLKKENIKIIALEQSKESVNCKKFRPRFPLALIAGNEVRGINKQILEKCDAVIEIPMQGKKNSLNVSVALGVAVYDICGRK